MYVFTQHLLFDFILTCVNGGDMWVCVMRMYMCQGFFFFGLSSTSLFEAAFLTEPGTQEI